MPDRAAVVTISDSVSAGKREDASGPAVAAILSEGGFELVDQQVVRDEKSTIERFLMRLCQRVDLIVTTGGTGLGPRDVTPEATRAVCDRMVDGLAELMRADGMRHTRFAALSRGICGARDQTLIINLPGSPKGAAQSLRSVIDLLPHALQLLRGNTEH
jgi:molybdenum cofactor synthesis domain-containing protein